MRDGTRQIGAALASWARRWWWAALLALTVQGGIALGIVLSQRVADQATLLMEQTAQIAEPDKRVSAQKDLLQYQTDNQVKIWTTLAQATLALAAAIGGYFTYRNLRVTQERLDVDRQAQITNRFTQAIGQLGAELKDGEPNLEVRLGGIYALERIARDSSRDHWPIMEVLTAYVRQNAPWPPRSITSPSPALWTPRPVNRMNGNSGTDESEAKPLRTDIQAILTVLGRRVLAVDRQEAAGLDLRETDLRRADLNSANLGRAYLNSANLEKANLNSANLEKANLDSANLEGADLWVAHLESAYLVHAHLEKANLKRAHLERANLWNANLEGAHLDSAHLERAYLVRANLESANLIGAHLEEVSLRDANLEGADLDRADLSTALNLDEGQLKSAASWRGALLPPDLAHLEDQDEKSVDVSAVPPSTSAGS